MRSWQAGSGRRQRGFQLNCEIRRVDLWPINNLAKIEEDWLRRSSEVCGE